MFAAVVAAVGVAAGCVRGAHQAPAVELKACPSAVGCQAPGSVQLVAEVGPLRLGFFVRVVATVLVC